MAAAVAGALWLRCRGRKPLLLWETTAWSVVETASRQLCKHHDAFVSERKRKKRAMSRQQYHRF
jgi:hypothetical protein